MSLLYFLGGAVAVWAFSRAPRLLKYLVIFFIYWVFLWFIPRELIWSTVVAGSFIDTAYTWIAMPIGVFGLLCHLANLITGKE